MFYLELVIFQNTTSIFYPKAWTLIFWQKSEQPPSPLDFKPFLNDTLLDGHFAFATTDSRQDDRKCDRSLNANADGRVGVEVSDIFRIDLSVVRHLAHEEGHAAQVRERAAFRRKNFCEIKNVKYRTPKIWTTNIFKWNIIKTKYLILMWTGLGGWLNGSRYLLLLLEILTFLKFYFFYSHESEEKFQK